jgi:hypothetical protein
MWGSGMFEGKLPSESMKLLCSLKGKVVRNVIRMMDCDFDRFMNDFGVSSNQIFQLGYGVLFIEFDTGEVVGFSDDSLKKSVIVWKEDNLGAEEAILYLKGKYDESYTIIDAKSKYSEEEWCKLIGQVIRDILIIKVSNEPFLNRRFANERGVLFISNQDNEMFLSHQLYNEGPAHLILMKRKNIRDELKEYIEYIEV